MELRKTSMARILCDNTDDFTDIQPDVFKMADTTGNSPLSCSDPALPAVDMEMFREASRP